MTYMYMNWSKTKPTYRSCRAVTELPISQCVHMLFTSNMIKERNLKQWTFFQCRKRSGKKHCIFFQSHTYPATERMGSPLLPWEQRGNRATDRSHRTRRQGCWIKRGRDWENSYRDLTNSNRNCSNAYNAVCKGNVRSSHVNHCISP